MPTEASIDGHEAVIGMGGSDRVVRGGSWAENARALHSSTRRSGGDSETLGLLGVTGFRVVRIAK